MQPLISQKKKLMFSLKKRFWEQVLHTIVTEHCVAAQIKILHFCLERCTEQRNLHWGDVVLETDSQGKGYLVHSEKQTESRQGDNKRTVRPMKPIMYENKEIQGKRNSVNVYKLYRDKRPRSMMEPDDPFYLTVNHFKSSIGAAERLYLV